MISDLFLEKEDFYLSLKVLEFFGVKHEIKRWYCCQSNLDIVPMDSIPKQVSNFGTVFELL
jgi:hypothetical protein